MRFGLLGTGYWAREVHAAGISGHPEAELVGVWGRDPGKARALAEPLGAQAYEDVDALLGAVDAVAIALPPDVQAPLAVRAADAGCHVLLEKPVALSGEAADRVVAAVERAGVRSVVFHTARFVPEIDAWLQDVLRAGDWDGGGVTLLVSIFEPGNPFGHSPWRREKGALWDVGPHALDMVISALGPVEGLVAGAGRRDTVHLVLRHASGASSALTLSLMAPPAAQTSAWWVYGPQGISERPEMATPPADALANAVSAIVTGADGGGGASDVHHGRDIVHLLARAEALLGRTPVATP